MAKVGALIPAYNEARTIKTVIKEAKEALPRCHVVVVDDGSTDRTAQLAKEAGAKVLRHEENRGKGEALRTGFDHILDSYPDVEWVVLVDADRQYFAKECGRLLEPLKRGEADFVMGYRDWGQMPFRHRLGNWVWRTAFNWLFGTKLQDTNCGFMALTREAMDKVKEIYGGYIIENSLLVNALKNKLRVVQVPVSVRYKRKRAVLGGIRVVSGILVFIVKEGLKWRLRSILTRS